ncbi:Nucleoporin nup57 [Lodderomyces elongisporus]|uniref:Nucleoporin nup57 n=1 Tax=Lodderomyces elongisporus TaxID=36914 RepID=UPI002921B3D1|nr:Nucleoporin nup57 [Lodderomyces elongisporus]WLF76405.1 Nucleoporin nup57 [Lodderomyces elongisporus]
MFGTASNTGTSGGGLFGSSNANQSTGGGLFGSKSAGSTPVFGSQQPQQQNTFGQTNTSGGGGLFGQAQPGTAANGSTSTGLFGSSQPKPAFGGSAGGGTGGGTGGGSLFGSNTSGSAFGSKPAGSTTGGLFGNNSNNNNNNNNNINNTAGNTGGLFGGNQSNSTSTGAGLFGNNNSTSNTGGLFGNNQQSGTNTTSGGGLFGGAGANKPSGGLFGGSSGTNQQSNTLGNSGGLFGNTQSTNNTGSNINNNNNTGGLFGNNQSSTTGGLFGNKPATSTTGGLFGSSTTNNSNTSGGLFGNKPAQSTSGSLFGQTQPGQQPQQQQQSGGLFGSNTLNNQQPSFSWNSQQSQPQFQQQQQQQNQQQNQLNMNQNASLFGNLGQANSNINNQQISNPSSYTPAINDQLAKIWEQWDPNSSKCGLKTHFYNKFNDQEIQQLLAQPRPANETVEDWDKAMAERPSPNTYPIKITSYTEVAQRIEAQLDQVAKSRVVLNSINEKLNTLSAKHDLGNTTRILKAKARHTQLSRRVLRLATVLAILKLKGYPLSPEEEGIAKQFDLLSSKINDPSSPIGKLGDIFAKLTVLKERAEDLNSQFDQSMHSLNGTLNGENVKENEQEESGNTEDAVNKIAKVLLKQQMGLNYLNDVLEKDSEKVQQLAKVKK